MIMPHTCVFGENPSASVLDFFFDLDGDALTSFTREIKNNVLPSLISAGEKQVQEIIDIVTDKIEKICELLGIIDNIIDLVTDTLEISETIEDLVEKVTGFTGTVVSKTTGFFSKLFGRRLEQGDETAFVCDDSNEATCSNDQNSICYRPFEDILPDMEGLCLDKTWYDKFKDEGSMSEAQALFSMLTGAYQKKLARENGESINNKIEETCNAPSDSPTVSTAPSDSPSKASRRLGNIASQPKRAKDIDKTTLSSMLDKELEYQDPRAVKALHDALGTKEHTSEEIVESIIKLVSGETEAVSYSAKTQMPSHDSKIIDAKEKNTKIDTSSSQDSNISDAERKKQLLRNKLHKSSKFDEAKMFGNKFGLSSDVVQDLFDSFVEEMNELESFPTPPDERNLATEFQEKINSSEDDIVTNAIAERIRLHVHGRLLSHPKLEDKCNRMVEDVTDTVKSKFLRKNFHFPLIALLTTSSYSMNHRDYIRFG